MPICYSIAVGGVATSATTKVDDIVQIGNGFDQGNSIPAFYGHQSVTVYEGINFTTGRVQQLNGCSRIGEVERAVQSVIDINEGTVFIDSECVSVVGQNHRRLRLNHHAGNGGVVFDSCSRS